jgi:hypothetical protein
MTLTIALAAGAAAGFAFHVANWITAGFIKTLLFYTMHRRDGVCERCGSACPACGPLAIPSSENKTPEEPPRHH